MAFKGSSIVVASPSLRGHRFVDVTLQRRAQSVPGQCRALHPDGIVAHAGEYGELAEPGSGRPRRGLSSDKVMEALEESFRLGLGLPFDALRHHGCRSRGNGAARALKAHVADNSVLHV